MSEETKQQPATGSGVIADDFSAFSGPVNDKSYTASPVQPNQADLQRDIPEPSFTPPPLNKVEEPFADDDDRSTVTLVSMRSNLSR